MQRHQLARASHQNMPGPNDLVAEADAGKAQPSRAIPAEKNPGSKREPEYENRYRQHREGFTFNQQCPINGLFPRGPDEVKNSPKDIADQWDSPQADMRGFFVRIRLRIIWNRLSRASENGGVFQLRVGGQMSVREAKQNMPGRIDNGPAVPNQSFHDDVFALAALVEQEEPPCVQAAALREIHEGIRRRAAHFEELLDIQRILRVAVLKAPWIGRASARGAVGHPLQDGFDFLHWIAGRRDNRVRKTFQIASR